jgi:alcohol dehydrogenase
MQTATQIQGFEFNTPRRIVCEIGAISKLAECCNSLGIERPFIVCDAGIIEHGLLRKLEEALAQSTHDISPCVFADVENDPSEATILVGIEQCQAHKADGIIALGGGSPMDVAKVIAVCNQNNQALSQIYGVNQVNGTRLPLILIPTTAGTGSEVTPIAIITTGEATKAGIVSPQLIPDIAILDAQLTQNLPPHVTAATGIDAMVHAIEAYTSKLKKNIYSDMLAKQALVLLSQNIETATFDGQNLIARQNMLLGACLAGQAFANAPVAAVHALAYPLGGHYHIPHGLSNALVLAHVMRFNLPEAEIHYSELAPLVVPNLQAHQSTQANALALIEHLSALVPHLHLPNRLRSLNIEHSSLDMLAKDAMQQTRLLVNNPREVTFDDALAIYEQAF